MSFIEFMRKGRRWLLCAFACAAIGIAWCLFGTGSANADPGSEQPQSPVTFTFPTLTLPIPQDLQQQANTLAAQAQTAFDNAVQITQKEASTALANLTQPAPAAIPAVAPAARPVISPEIDKAITDTLPASLPELTQRVVDPVIEAGLSAAFGVPAKMPAPERMDKNAPLSTQIGAAIDLFLVKDVTPDLNACGGDSIEAKTACGAALVADNIPDDRPVAKINLVSRYGVEAWITPWGSVCGGYMSSMAYCGEIYASKPMFHALAAKDGNPTQAEVTLILGHENQHSRDATQFAGGPGKFFQFTGADDANEFKFEQRADTGGMSIVRSAVEKGQLPPEAVDESFALLSRIGHTMPDGTPEPTHGSSDDRIAAGKRDIKELDEDHALLAAA